MSTGIIELPNASVVGNSDRNQDVLEFETCERF